MPGLAIPSWGRPVEWITGEPFCGFRIIDVAPGGRLTLANVTVANGSGAGIGGGILDQGSVGLRNVRLTGNTAPDGGGMFIASGGRATVSFSVVAPSAAAATSPLGRQRPGPAPAGPGRSAVPAGLRNPGDMRR